MQAQLFILLGLDWGIEFVSKLNTQTARPLGISIELCRFPLMELFCFVEIAVKIHSVTSRVRNRIVF